jgi:hypothetical protein
VGEKAKQKRNEEVAIYQFTTQKKDTTENEYLNLDSDEFLIYTLGMPLLCSGKTSDSSPTNPCTSASSLFGRVDELAAPTV